MNKIILTLVLAMFCTPAFAQFGSWPAPQPLPQCRSVFIVGQGYIEVCQ